MYKLIIQDQNGVWRTADLGDDATAFNFEMMDIASLKDRQANYSQSLSLPTTPNNMRIFGHINSPQVVSKIPYSLYECRLLYDCEQISGNGSYLKILSLTSKKIDVQIISGVGDIFEKLKEIKLTEEDRDIFGTVCTPFWGVLQSKNLQSRIVYLDDGMSVGYGNNYLAGDYDQWNLPYMMPALSLRYAIETLLNRLGYTFKSSVDTSMYALALIDRSGSEQIGNVTRERVYRTEGYTTYYGDKLTFNDIKIQTPSSCYIEIEATLDYNLQFNPVSVFAYNYGNDTFQSMTVYNESNSSIGYSDIINKAYRDFLNEFLIQDDANINFGWNLSASKKYYRKVCRLYMNGRIDMMKEDGTFDTIKTYSFGTLTSAKKIVLNFYQNSGNVSSGIRVPFKISFHGNGNECAYENMYVAEKLGFKTGQDLIKAFLQLFGLSAIIDHNNKIVNFKSWNEINKSQSRDWSDKLQQDSEEITYSINGYARRNIITLLENNSDSTIKDQYIINVNDQRLDYEKEIIKIELESQDIFGITYYITEVDEDGNIKTDFKKLKASSLLKIKSNEAYTMNVGTILKQSYDKINDIVNEAVVVKAEFNLSIQDVINFDHFIPVYLNQYGAYFYVNKIENFIAGQLTKVELVKI